MKVLHLADLHFGKNLHNLSLIESGDQAFWVDQILKYIERERPDAVVIAGDVYDRGVPSKEAIPLLSRLLEEISNMEIPVLLTAGNHDGGERLEFASGLLANNNVYVAGIVQKDMVHVTLDSKDGYGPVTFWLMPFLFPAAVRQALGRSDDELTTYTDAAKALLAEQPIDFSQRNVLVAHQTVIANGEEVKQSGSETAIAGVGGIDISAFDGFDYVALGHIHGAQPVGRPEIRYAGAPLCYHFSEVGQKKGPLMVELGEKGADLKIRADELPVLHKVRATMVGTLEEIKAAEADSTARGEYVRVVLTDEWVPSDTREQLESLFESHGCKMLDLSRETAYSHNHSGEGSTEFERELSLDEHFLQFYRKQMHEEDPEKKDSELIRFTADMIGRGGDVSDEQGVMSLVDFVLKQEENA